MSNIYYKLYLADNAFTYMQPDFYSEEHSIIGEIFAHIGENKRGQSTKIANDILKMLLIEKDRCKSYRKMTKVCIIQIKSVTLQYKI